MTKDDQNLLVVFNMCEVWLHVACCLEIVLTAKLACFKLIKKSMFFGRTFKETVPRSNLLYIIKIMEN